MSSKHSASGRRQSEPSGAALLFRGRGLEEIEKLLAGIVWGGRRSEAIAGSRSGTGRPGSPLLLLVASVGPGPVFLLNALTFLGTIVVLARWRRAPRQSVLPAERLIAAMRTGLRYTRAAPELKAVLVRAGAFVVGGSALLALLPLVARNEMGLDAAGYGVLLGALGLRTCLRLARSLLDLIHRTTLPRRHAL